jgi:hypothetical protein
MNQEMCDEEKSYHEWVAQNVLFIGQNKDCVRIMKKLYMDGFAAGFMYKNKINVEEQLQK